MCSPHIPNRNNNLSLSKVSKLGLSGRRVELTADWENGSIEILYTSPRRETVKFVTHMPLKLLRHCVLHLYTEAKGLEGKPKGFVVLRGQKPPRNPRQSASKGPVLGSKAPWYQIQCGGVSSLGLQVGMTTSCEYEVNLGGLRAMHKGTTVSRSR